jgi:hypothetical protein
MRTARILIFGLCAALRAANVSADPTPASSTVLSAPSQATAPAAAATTTPVTPVPPAGQSEDNSYTYVTGYSDGCASANLRYARQEHVKPNKDATRYDSDKGYHDGWNHGYRKCEDRSTPGAISVPGNSIIM